MAENSSPASAKDIKQRARLSSIMTSIWSSVYGASRRKSVPTARTATYTKEGKLVSSTPRKIFDRSKSLGSLFDTKCTGKSSDPKRRTCGPEMTAQWSPVVTKPMPVPSKPVANDEEYEFRDSWFDAGENVNFGLPSSTNIRSRAHSTATPKTAQSKTSSSDIWSPARSNETAPSSRSNSFSDAYEMPQNASKETLAESHGKTVHPSKSSDLKTVSEPVTPVIDAEAEDSDDFTSVEEGPSQTWTDNIRKEAFEKFDMDALFIEPLSCLPTPPPEAREVFLRDDGRTPQISDELWDDPEYMGRAKFLMNFIPSNAFVGERKTWVIQSIIIRCRHVIDANMIAMAGCILDQISPAFINQWHLQAKPVNELYEDPELIAITALVLANKNIDDTPASNIDWVNQCFNGRYSLESLCITERLMLKDINYSIPGILDLGPIMEAIGQIEMFVQKEKMSATGRKPKSTTGLKSLWGAKSFRAEFDKLFDDKSKKCSTVVSPIEIAIDTHLAALASHPETPIRCKPLPEAVSTLSKSAPQSDTPTRNAKRVYTHRQKLAFLEIENKTFGLKIDWRDVELTPELSPPLSFGKKAPESYCTSRTTPTQIEGDLGIKPWSRRVGCIEGGFGSSVH